VPRRQTPSSFDFFSVERSSQTPAYRQLYEQGREAILTGVLKPGTALPSTRGLAEELGVARGTVIAAYEMLVSEGYLTGAARSAIRVSPILPEELLIPLAAEPPSNQPSNRRVDISKRGSLMASSSGVLVNPVLQPRPIRPFEVSVLAVDQFPFKLWGAISSRQFRRIQPDDLDYCHPAGYLPLREAVADYLNGARSVTCTAAQVLIVSGSQQALDLIARSLLDPGDQVWVEDPIYLGAKAAFTAAGAELVPVPVGPEGLEIEAGMERGPMAKFAYVTPSSQSPLGVTMSLRRRLELIEWAREQSAWIVEDDYDSEFRYAGQPLPALQGLDRSGRTFYVGTFSKVLFPSLRLGYLVVPEHLVDVFTRIRAVLDLHSPLLEQKVLAEFIGEGHFVRHIRRMRRLYAERQAALIKAAGEHLAGSLTIAPRDSGLYSLGWLPDGASEAEAVVAAARQGVSVTALGTLRLQSAVSDRPGLLLGFAAFEPEAIQQGVRKLAQALG
jgi:GntR family transcriptional regulator/MocR family aminotransferase